MRRLTDEALTELARELYGQLLQQVIVYPDGGMTVILTGEVRLAFTASGERFVFSDERRNLTRGRVERLLRRCSHRAHWGAAFRTWAPGRRP